MATHTIRSGSEILELKCNWLADPCWDIEETEGFDAHRDELRAFRLQNEAERHAKRQAHLEARASELGCTVALVRYLENLESQIKQLDKELAGYANPD